MDYNELNLLIKRKFSSLKEFCSAIGITENGFRDGVVSKRLGMKYISAACKALDITPNEFFGWSIGDNQTGVYASNITGINTQNSNEAIQALREESKEKTGIIKEKDRQINRLLTIIERNKLK